MVGARVKEGIDATLTKPVADAAATAAATAVAKATNTAKKVAKNVVTASSTPLTGTDAVAPTSTDSVAPATAENMTTMNGKKKNRIDYASTIEDAYDDLNKIIGGDGIKRLTDDTQRLMGQQMQLADAMKSMSPLLEQAKTMLQGFDLKNLDGLAQMAKQFTAPGGATGLQMPKM